MAIGNSKFWGRLSRMFPSAWQWTRDLFFQGITRISWVGEHRVQIDIEDPITAYNDCPHLQIVIDRKAQMFSNGQWLCFEEKDVLYENPIEGDEGINLLNNPNAMQSGEEFLKQYMYYKELFSNGFMYKLKGSMLVEVPKALWHLPSNLMEIVMTGKMFNQFELDQIIKEYVLTWGGSEIKYTTDEVIYKAENFSIDQGKGMSKIPALKLPINNIIAAYRTRNIIITNKGIFGFMSSDNKDAAGTIAMDKDERKRVEDTFSEDANLYSDRAKMKVTTTPTKWNSMSFPMKDLLLYEEIEDDFAAILGMYGMDRDLFPTVNTSKLPGNKKQAEILTYNSTIQPEADALAEIMTKQLGADKRGKKYILDYSWLPAMQKDKKEEEEVSKAKADKLSILLDKNIIDRQTFADAMNVKLAKEKPPAE